MHNVVFQNILEGTHCGVITWTSFESKEAFDEWYNEKMKSWYQVVEEGVSEQRAIELCSSPEAHTAVLVSACRELIENLDNLNEELRAAL